MAKVERTRKYGAHSLDKLSDRSVSSATLRGVRISPRKARLIINMIRGKHVDTALGILRHSPKKGARIVEKLLQSAIANANNGSGVDVDLLWIAACSVDMGQTLKRFMPRAQGRATEIKKKTSQITLVLSEKN